MDTIYPDTLAEVILGKVEEYVAPNKLIKTVYDPQTDIPALEKIFAHSVTAVSYTHLTLPTKA